MIANETIKIILDQCCVGASRHQLEAKAGMELGEALSGLVAAGRLIETDCACGHCVSYVTTPAGKELLMRLAISREWERQSRRSPRMKAGLSPPAKNCPV